MDPTLNVSCHDVGWATVNLTIIELLAAPPWNFLYKPNDRTHTQIYRENISATL